MYSTSTTVEGAVDLWLILFEKKNQRSSQRKGKQNGKGKNQKSSNRNDGLSRGSYLNSGTLIVPSSCLGMPRRIKTNVRIAFQGFLPAAAATSGYCTIFANTLTSPFNTASPITGGTFSTFTATDGSSIVANPSSTGFWSSGYELYRVYAARLRVKCVTGNGGDTVNVWIVPVPLNNAIANQNLQRAAGQPGFQRVTCTAGMAPGTMTSNIIPSQVLGMTPEEYRTSKDTQALFTATPPAIGTAIWTLNYATCDGAAVGGQVYFEIEVEQDYECWEIIQPAN